MVVLVQRMAHAIVQRAIQDQRALCVKSYYIFITLHFSSYNRFIEDIGCLANQSLSCLNDGICLSNGICRCEYGYSGATCAECKFHEII